MSEAQQAILQQFLVESFDNLSNINDDLSQYEKNPSDNEMLNSIYRKVHTLKGSASFLGLNALQEITHAVETILDYVRDGEFQLSTETFDLFLESFDYCHLLLKNVEDSGQEGDVNYSDLLSRLNQVLTSPPKVEVNIIRDDSLSLVSSEEPVKVDVLKEEGNPVKEVGEKQPVKPKTESADKTREMVEKAKVSKSNLSDSIVRVNVNLLDKIMNVVGELVITRNQILQYSKLQEDSSLNRYAQQLNTITTELQTDIMTTRMQPVGSVFNKFERIVRDLSRSQGKKVRLTLIGQETELDKTLLEVIKDPMTHLIRNSLDHGLEHPEKREELGKNPEGHLEIKAFHEGGEVIIEIVDDGAGINSEKVKNKALEKGIITESEAASLSSAKIQSLIFAPGFSTAEQVTNISGRGVGMDVVKSNIEKIGGEVEVISKEGKGTTFRLKIPLTLAIVPALVIESGSETFAIHQKNLVELVMLEENDFGKIENLHNKEFFRLRGELIPIVRLNEVLKLTSAESAASYINIIVLKAEGRTYGLVVDNILDTQEIVVKPLDRKLKGMSHYAGSTIMGDGRVALIIDAFGFYNQIDNQSNNKDDDHLEVTDTNREADYESMELVLFKLNDKRTYGIPLSLINRLEEIDVNSIEWAGEQAIIRYRGGSMPLLNCEHLLSLEGGHSFKERGETKLNCIVTTMGGMNFGFIVTEILDIAYNESALETDTIDRDGLLGTVYIDEKLISLLDIYTLVSKTNLGQRVLGSSENIRLQGKVLIVDDSPLFRRVQEDLMRGAGLDVILANNGEEGITVLKANADIDLIVTDIEMPVVDGYEFSQEVRAFNESIPIIAVSTKIGDSDKVKGREAGFSYHLEKLNKKEVLDTIEICLKKVG